MKGCASVVHLSGLVGDPACALDPAFTRHANVIATRMVRDVALSLGIYRIVFASSCSVYGENEKEVNENIRSRSAKLRYAIRNGDSFFHPNEFKKKFVNYFELEGGRI